MIVEQADMWDPEKGPAHQQGFEGVFGFDNVGYGFVKNQYDASRDIVGDIAKQVACVQRDGAPVQRRLARVPLGQSARPRRPLRQGTGLRQPVTHVPDPTKLDDDWTQHPNAYGNLANFHRITVHGSTTPLEWLKLTINPRAHAAPGDYAIGPFSWQRMIQQ